MDIELKKQEVLEDIARQPSNVLFSRIDIINQILLSNLLKTNFASSLVGAANTSHSNSENLHTVCSNLAKQRALLQGASVSTIMQFDIGQKSDHSNMGTLSYPKMEDSTYNNKTTFPYIVLHDLNEDGGIIDLSSSPNATKDIENDEGNFVTYFSDFSKYFLTRSRANGELVSIDDNNAPYTTPTAAEPFFPANTINGETYSGTATDPTANSDVRHDFFLTPNTTSVGFAGANNDITENKYTGNTFVTLELSEVDGSFTSNEVIIDFDGNSGTIKNSSNTTTVILESFDSKGTFSVGETITDLSSNVTIQSIETVSNTEVNITVTGSTFLTGSNTDVSLGFGIANTLTLEENTVKRTGNLVSVTANNHGIKPGEYVVLKGADETFGEFNDTFIVEDVTQNTLTFSTSNAVSVTPTGDFSLVKNLFFGRTSNASAAIHTRTTNSSATLVYQSDDLDLGFAIGNTITGQSTNSSGKIDKRTKGGAWYQVKTNEVKTYYIASDSGTWDYDASNNPQGIESSANTGEFWLKNFEMVKLNQLVGIGSSYSSRFLLEDDSGVIELETSTDNIINEIEFFDNKKVVLDIPLATASDISGGYNSNIRTNLPGVYFSYPLKTYEDQVFNGVTTLDAFSNFANIVVAPEGLEINLSWKPLGNTSGVALNGTHINQNGTVTDVSFNPEECTTLNKTSFNSYLGPFDTIQNNPLNDVYRSVNPNNRSSALKVGGSYPNVNANPFFPAVGGTHKNHTDTLNSITGTQPAGLNANDIYAGAYTEYQQQAQNPTGDYRYVVQNDQKWIYASNVFDANSSISGSYSTPRNNDIKGNVFDGSLDGEIGNNVDESSTPSPSAGSVTTTIPANNPVTCSIVSHIGNQGQLYSMGTYNGRSNMVQVTNQYCGGDSGTCSYGGYTTPYACEVEAEPPGTWTWHTVQTNSSTVEFGCLYNRIQYLLTNNGGSLTVNSTTNMRSNFAVLYTLLMNLYSSSYGKDYLDPVERPEASGYTEEGRSDTDFKLRVEELKTAIDAVIGLHNTERANVIANIGSSYSHPSNYRTTFEDMKTKMIAFRYAVKNRITEITNRIGGVNGKNVGSGGNTSFQVSVGGVNTGFTGYPFNNGNGYANTIYSQSNFLAGKKLKLLELIASALNDMDTLYEQIQSKRAEYYEYNQ